jgi:hypothetical protein
MGKYFSISSYIRKPVLIYDFATAPLRIFLYMRKIDFLFYQCRVPAVAAGVPGIAGIHTFADIRFATGGTGSGIAAVVGVS